MDYDRSRRELEVCVFVCTFVCLYSMCVINVYAYYMHLFAKLNFTGLKSKIDNLLRYASMIY